MSPAPGLARRLVARRSAFLADVAGSTAIEYTIIASLLSVAIIACMAQITTPLSGLLVEIAARFDVK